MTFEMIKAPRGERARMADGTIRCSADERFVRLRFSVTSAERIGCSAGDHIDLMIDRSQSPHRIAIVPGSSLKLIPQGRCVTTTASALRGLTDVGKWNCALSVIEVGGKPALSFTLPEKTTVFHLARKGSK